MTMLSSEIYSQVKYFEIETNRILNSTFSGEYQSAFKGRGIEFEEVRPYIEGDDIRFIDWNVTAKMNQPFVKIFREERELSNFLLIDGSASMYFGSTTELKKELLIKISALLSLVSMKNNDRVGLIIFTDKVEKVIMPKKGRKHVLTIIEEILRFTPVNKTTNLASPLEFLAKLKIKKSVIFILSDFKSPDFKTPLEIVARKHDIIPILFSDHREKVLPRKLVLRLEDLENNTIKTLNLHHHRLQTEFTQKIDNKNKKLRQYFISLAIDFIELETGKPYLTSLINYFRRRTRRRQF